MKWFRKRESLPPLLEHVYVVLANDERIEVVPIYVGRDPQTRMHEWLVQVPEGLPATAVEIDRIPGRTSVHVVGMTAVTKWPDEE